MTRPRKPRGSVSIGEQLYIRLRDKCKADGKRIAPTIEQAINQYIDEQETQP